MRGRLALEPEVLGCPNQSAPEELLPHAVDGDARRERVVLRQDPISKVETCRRSGRVRTGQEGRRPRHDLDTLAIPLPSNSQEGLGGLLPLADDARLARLRIRGLELLELLSQLLEPQLLDALLGNNRVVPVDEVVGQHLAFPERALCRVLAQDFPAVISHLEQDVVAEVPVRAFAGVRAGDLHLAFPLGLQFRNVMLVEQCLALPEVLASLAQVRPHLARQRRVDLRVLHVVEVRVERIEVLLRDRVVLVVMALCALHGQP